MILIESFFLVILIYMLFMLFLYKDKFTMEILGSYECGFEPLAMTRITFSYRFFLISVLFIIFDVEISLMVPLPFLMEEKLGFWMFLFFLIILVWGLLYEYWYGSLNWLNIIKA